MATKDSTSIFSSITRQYSWQKDQEGQHDTIHESLSLSIQQADEEDKEIALEIRDWDLWLRSNEGGGDCRDAVTLPLEHQRVTLIQKWQDFQCKFRSPSSRQSLNEIPTIEALQAAISEAQNEWDDKHKKGFGKAKTRLFDLLDSMNDHSYFFKFVPTSDKYVCLITGVLSSVVKASVNYREIASNLSSDLGTIHTYLRSARQKVQLWNDTYIKSLAVNLYVQVFGFLCGVMSWFSSHRIRLKTSWDKNYYKKEIQPTIDKVQEIVGNIRNESVHCAEATIQDTYLKIQEMEKNIRGIKDELDTRSKMSDWLWNLDIQERRFMMGIKIGEMLQALEEQHFFNRIQTETSPEFLAGDYTGEISNHANEIPSQNEYTEPCSRGKIQSFVEPLLAYMEDGREEISRTLGGISSQTLPGEVLLSMQKWLQDPSSRMIWIEGSSPEFYGSSLSLAAMRVCSLCMTAEMPFISVFCKNRYKFQKSRSASDQKEASLVGLLYSIISQLAYLIPPKFRPVEGIDEEDFKYLDGTLNSATPALDIIEALVSLQLPALIWIIDGLQLAEDHNTRAYLKRLVNILRSPQEGKVCFTTNGNSRALLQTIKNYERVDASRMLQGGARQPFKGGLQIQTLQGRFG